MGHKERLGKMSVKALRKEISAHNKLLKGYSKMRKSEIIDLIIKNRKLFPNLFTTFNTGNKKTIMIKVKKKKKKAVTDVKAEVKKIEKKVKRKIKVVRKKNGTIAPKKAPLLAI
tara:strand:+ start:5950 stop:6291 length:342 start_codon:yes stop_codon:yes gene_type:complete